jgi:hypothetical protein
VAAAVLDHHTISGANRPTARSHMNERNPGAAAERARLERQLNQLANERSALFDKAGASFGLSNDDQQRLTAVEHELDECFRARRQLRADRDAQRFDREQPFIRRQSRPKPAP